MIRFESQLIKIREFWSCSSASMRYLNYKKIINGLKVKIRSKTINLEHMKVE